MSVEFEGRSRITTRLDIAPLIDVMMLLLVFFMLTTTFLLPQAIDLDLPSSSTASTSEELPTVVLLNAEGQTALNNEIVSRDDLGARAAELLTDADQQVISLKTDAAVSVQDMLEVMDILRNAGWRNVALATESGDLP